MKTRISNLIEVRKIIAFLAVFLFIVMSLREQLQTDFIQNVILTIIAFYFAKSADKEDKNK